MVLDAMKDMTPRTGIGFRSVIRVRMLHSQVRLRILRSGKFDVQEYGVPINQEDLIATLGAFSVAVIWSMERMKIFISHEDKEAYIAAWRHIGYYMGIQTVYLRRFYSDYDSAEKHLCSSITHLLEPELGKPSGMLPLRLLNGIAKRPLYGHSLEYHAELSRLLLGDDLADIFQLPRGNLITRSGVWVSITMMRLELWFGRWYRRGWELERVRVMREFVDWLVMWQVGRRKTFERTDFRSKPVVVDTADSKTALPNGVNGSAQEKEDTEDSGNVKVQVDRKYIKALKRRYYRIIVVEPALIVAGCFGMLAWASWTWLF
jgi:ER-bound oxygenase mpaB/B'/Rubber oxygenase, catalytic domain